MVPRYVTVPAGVIAHIGVAFHIWMAFANGITPLQALIAAVLGWWFVDLCTLLAHWLLDNYFSEKTPIIGQTIFFFRQHHVQPKEMFKRDWFDGNFEHALAVCVTMAVVAAFDISPLWSMFWGVAGLGGSHVTQVHKWAHDANAPAPVQLMQHLHIVVDAKHHAEHHKDPRGHYALFAGHIEPVFEGLRIPQIVEASVYLATGSVAVESRLKLGKRGETLPLKDRLDRVYWRGWYSLLAWYTERRGARFTCMNWGYDEPTWADDEMGPERLPLQLYRRLVEGLDLEGKRLVDISCGRGGGIHWVHTHAGLDRTTGVDFTPGNVSLCQAAFPNVDGLDFLSGDAESMPFGDSDLDALMSVEASHCYPQPARFLNEAARVLKPGGYLLWTDFRPRDEVEALRAMIPEDLEFVEDIDITARVIRAMELDGPRRRALIDEHSSPVLRRVMTTFAAADEDADTVKRFTSGEAIYFLWRLRKHDTEVDNAPRPAATRTRPAAHP